MGHWKLLSLERRGDRVEVRRRLAYDFTIRDVLIARSEKPAPGVEEHGRTVEDAV